MYPDELSKLFIRRIYAKGTVTMRDCMDAAMKKKIGVSCAEGRYTEDYMYQMAFEFIVTHFLDQRVITPIFKDPEIQKLWEKWTNSEEYSGPVHTADHVFENLDEDDRDVLMEVIYTTPIRFAPGARKKYLAQDIEHLEYVCS